MIDWQIQDTPEGRFYYDTDSGERYPSVTTILDVIRQKKLETWRGHVGNQKADWAMEDGAERGTLVHEIAAQSAAYKGAPLFAGEPKDPEIANRVAAWRVWFLENVLEVIAIEVTTHHPAYMYAGTVDLVARLKGRDGIQIVDYKTGVRSSLAKLQTAGYAESLIFDPYFPSIDIGESVGRGALYLGAEGPAVFVDHDTHAADVNGFLSAFGTYQWVRGNPL
jgi:hypothetical protein